MTMETVRGWVRPCISLSLTGLVVYLGIVGDIHPDDVMKIFSIVVGFYFGERAALKLKQPTNGGQQ